MRFAKTIVLFVISLVLSVLATVFMLTHALNGTLLQPYSWNEYISSDKLGALIGEKLEISLKEHAARIEGYVPDILPRKSYQLLIENAVDMTTKQLITSPWLEVKIDEYQRNVWDYLTGESDRIKPLQLDDVIRSFAAELDAELASYGFPGSIAGSIAEQFVNRVHIEFNPLENMQVEQVRDYYNRYQASYRFLPVAFALTALAGLIVAFYPKTVLRWGGLTLAWLGLLLTSTLFLVMAADGFAQGTLAGAWVERSALDDLLFDSGSLLVQNIAYHMTDVWLPLAPLAIACGLIVFAIGRLSPIERVDARIRSALDGAHILRSGRFILCALILAGVFIYGVWIDIR